ncbi:restriction endonuclease subunit S [Neptunomonas sp. CHC150]|uniref:restriction endonuclease subunit S n=1 Tax=Neptunomonas sp. CHC150 TaxID=2998324 RepID=UPI0025B1E692|nr:restriction endonuclease subunit S [Neptunomonas sp. CHC150]MDN2659473.1 restriction endonuclease subunit S [Neptunomonas sp. CHC150]
MGSEWKEVGLNELGEVARGRSRHRPRYADHLYGGPYPFIQTGDVKASGGLITSHSQTYSEDGLAQSRLWPKNTMCITIAANIAETGILTYPACFPDSVIGFIADEKKCDVRFIEYRIRYLKSQLQREAIGSVQDNINLATFERLKFSIPSLAEQKGIAYVLGTLDNKIQLNRQINQTLEQMAQALFKSWFVDFDPVIDNALAAGNPIPEELQARAQRRQQQLAKPDHQPLPDDVRQLFPSEFEETEALGWVPKGWECSYISDFCLKIQNGGTPKRSESKFWDDGCIPWLASGEVRQSIITKTKSFITEDGLAKSSAKIVPKGTTVIAMYGATAGQVAYSAIDMSTNQAVCSLIPRKGTSYFVYLTMERLVIELEKQARGSAQQNISKGIIEETILLYPSAELLNYFDDVVRPIFDKWEASIKSNESLSKLRDTLLPKLISGELRLPESMLDSETNPPAETTYE